MVIYILYKYIYNKYYNKYHIGWWFQTKTQHRDWNGWSRISWTSSDFTAGPPLAEFNTRMEVLVLQKVPFRMIECLLSGHLYLLKQESYLSILSKLALPKNYLPSTEGHCHGLINDGWVLEPYCDRRSFGIASKRAAEAAAKETMIQYCQSWFCLTTIGSQAFWTGMTALSLPAYKTFFEKVQLLDKK